MRDKIYYRSDCSSTGRSEFYVHRCQLTVPSFTFARSLLSMVAYAHDNATGTLLACIHFGALAVSPVHTRPTPGARGLSVQAASPRHAAAPIS